MGYWAYYRWVKTPFNRLLDPVNAGLPGSKAESRPSFGRPTAELNSRYRSDNTIVSKLRGRNPYDPYTFCSR